MEERAFRPGKCLSLVSPPDRLPGPQREVSTKPVVYDILGRGVAPMLDEAQKAYRG